MNVRQTQLLAPSSIPSATVRPEQPEPSVKLRLPELLAPAGDWDCARAAVENGADAIYFGLERFNARMRAQNFTEADLPKLMEYLHGRGVKGYVTFNTLVFANELAEAEQYLRTIIAAGLDAAIVQDVGICRLIRRLSPDFPIHASTQMTITSAAGVEFAGDLGCQLVVLARECSIKEIEKIQAALASDSQLSTPNSQLPLEVFVHGALCVAYSGQCLTSEALGGRSANRGECAQACRMPYDLISDGKLVPLGDRRYLLSPQDLAGLEVLPELIRSGVASLKIEGRLKSPEYVANITRIYRKALDTAAGFCFDGTLHESATNAAAKNSASASDEFGKIRRESQYDLEMAFSRGLYPGWMHGVNNQELVHARFGKKRGVYLGQVTRVERETIALNLQAPLKPGDGVVFDAGHPDEKEEGGRVYSVDKQGMETRLGFGQGDLNFRRIQIGDRIWKTSDPELDRRLRQTFTDSRPRFRRPLHFDVHGCVGEPLTLIARDELGHIVQTASAMQLTKAEKQPLTVERLRDQLGRLGGTAFALGELRSFLESSVILPMSELNRLRRETVRQLESLRTQPKRWTLNPVTGGADSHCLREPNGELSARALSSEPRLKSAGPFGEAPRPGTRTENAPTFHLVVLVRNFPQLEAALQCGVNTLYCEFEDPKKYREAVARFRQHQEKNKRFGPVSELTASAPTDSDVQSPLASSRPEIFVAPPRIFKMGEEWTLKQVRSSDADGYLVRNYDHLKVFADTRMIGDFSLNVANSLSADYFKSGFGLERVTASYDLNFSQLEALLKSAPPEWFEITIHQHIPMFHMEHCVFCAFLSQGTDYTNCGRPCDQHEVRLRDRVGAEHPLKADVGCRNTVFNALAQTGAEHVSRMLSLGARHFRIEFLNESPDQVSKTIAKYRQLLLCEISGTELWRELKLLNQLGVTRGQL